MTDANPPGTPIPFSRDEASKIRAAFAEHTEKIPCPRCGRTLTVSRPLAGGGTVPPVHEVRCEPCRCAVLVASGS